MSNYLCLISFWCNFAVYAWMVVVCRGLNKQGYKCQGKLIILYVDVCDFFAIAVVNLYNIYKKCKRISGNHFVSS